MLRLRNWMHVSALVVVLLCCGFGGARDVVLRVGIEENYEPFSFVNAQGVRTGFDVEFAQALCEHMGKNCVYVAMPFEELLRCTRTGELDFTVAGMAATEERRRFLLFSDVYYRSHSIYIGRAEFRDDIEKLRGKRIGVKLKTLQAQYLLDRWGGKAQLVARFTTVDELLGALKQGELDAVLVDGFAGYKFLASEENESFALLSDPLLPAPKSSGSRIAITKGRADLVPDINAAIRSIRLDDTFSKLSRKYFSFDIY